MGADAWKKKKKQVSTQLQKISLTTVFIWKAQSSSQIHKLLGFDIASIYRTCKCLNISHLYSFSMYIFLKRQDTIDHKQRWANY